MEYPSVSGLKELPRFQCHKKVGALKIKYVDSVNCVIVPEDAAYQPFTVDRDYIVRFNPQPGGYFVEYEDGYQSFSPAEAFESGYTMLHDKTPSL